jgi:hypothetical protein
MSTKNVLQFLGFLLFVFGLLSLVLILVGANLSMLTFIDSGGKLIGFVIRLLMVFGGVVLFYLARTDWEKENEE